MLKNGVMSALKLTWKTLIGGMIFLLVYSPFRPAGPYEMESARELDREDHIEVTVHLRNYMTGPIDDQFAVYTHDMIKAYAGPVHPFFMTRVNDEDPKKMRGLLRVWAMVGVNDGEYQECILQAIHNFGESAFFACPKPGVYRVYAMDRGANEGKQDDKGNDMEPPTFAQTDVEGDDPIMVHSTRAGLKYFRMFSEDGNNLRFENYEPPDTRPAIFSAEDKHNLLRKVFLRLNDIIQQNGPYGTPVDPQVAISEPIYVEDTTNCFYWMYRTDEIARAGYVGDTEVLPEVGTDGSSYILIDILIWIGEPRAVPVEEAQLPLGGKLMISEYSKMLTKRYYNLGLTPCLRKAHQAIEILKPIAFVLETDADNKLQSPHWRASLKIHTDRLLTTLSDVSFTIGGRQNSALFGCFVGDTRVFLDTKVFQFVPQTVLDRNSINLKLSKLQDVFRQKVKFQITQIYGHGVQYIGNSKARRYQPSTSRTDLVIINNPCMIQEFAIAVGGSLYIAEGFLDKGMRQTKKVYLPGLDDTNTPGKNQQSNRFYLRVSDVAFTPTHFVVLLTGGIVILHPTSIRHKGLGRLSNTGKYRPDSFVKRRWCGRTSTPKLSNMIVPAYSAQGSIIIIQIYPIEGSVHMWVNPPAQTCVAEGQGFIGKAATIRKNINERDIHHNEFISINRSDDRGIPVPHPPPRPVPPKPKFNRDEKLKFLVQGDNLVEDGSDPHFPPQLSNPASEVIGDDLTDYNSAVIYVLNSIDTDKNKLALLLAENDLPLEEDSFDLHVMEFAAVEKQFVVGARFESKVISDAFQRKDTTVRPLQMLITTMTATNLPTQVKVVDEVRGEDEELDTLIPFPGMILLRSRPFMVDSVESRDPYENEGGGNNVDDSKEVEFRVKIFPVNTAIPSYVIDVGNVLIFSSLDGRIARPLYFYEFCYLDRLLNPLVDLGSKAPKYHCNPNFHSGGEAKDPPFAPSLKKPPKIFYDESALLLFRRDKDSRMYDVVVTDQGLISVLWRKSPRRHLVQDDQVCLATEESDYRLRNSFAIGSVLINEALRDIHGFFQNDNIFQMATPDGEIVYGKYDVKPHSPFEDCDEFYTPPPDKLPPEICIQQAKKPLKGQKEIIKVCSKSTLNKPCRDPAYLRYCPPHNPEPVRDTEACLRLNNITFFVKGCEERFVDDVIKNQFPRFREGDWERSTPNKRIFDGGEDYKKEECYTDMEIDDKVQEKVKDNTGLEVDKTIFKTRITKCWPKHAPREELRRIQILGTSFYGYLHGSLKSVKSVHPEARVHLEDHPNDLKKPQEDRRKIQVPNEALEPDVCPFIGFNVYNTDFDYADVGYETRITGVISFLGKAIPTEADLLVEFQPTMGAVVEISTSVIEQRDLTTITKTIDIKFVLTDFQLEEMQNAQHDFSEEDFKHQRAREKSSVFSITIRPSIVNLYCKSSDYFKTIQFSVGCNTFSNIRLISEAAPFWPFNWTKDRNDGKENLQWKLIDGELAVPRSHVFHLQVKHGDFNCTLKDGRCLIPYYELYGDPTNPEIFTTSYRDPFFPRFEQFLTRSTRNVTGNMILYDLFGSDQFDVNVTALDARCFSIAEDWYDELRKSTQYITKGASEHEYIYRYFRDCFSNKDPKKRVPSEILSKKSYHVFNLTNQNAITFRRQRNHIYVFRAVLVNTEYNRFSYCKTLETFFLVRITGLPIPRQGLQLWIYVTVILVVLLFLVGSYVIFYHFYTWKLDSTDPMPDREGQGRHDGDDEVDDRREREESQRPKDD